MAKTRKDSKGRILRTGETQGKDGRYKYQYTDAYGKRSAVYAWRLEWHDRIVPGKPKDLSLREKEQKIQADLFDQIVPQGAGMPVVELVEKYCSLKIGVSRSTQAGYNTVITLLGRDAFGRKRIDRVKISDAKSWLIGLQSNGKGFSSVRQIRGVLRPAFQLAVDDDLIRKNPFDFPLMSVVYNDSVTREAISREDERRFFDFIKNDAHFSRYYDGFFILFNTGLRISEFVGLTKNDVDFDSHKIDVNHQLQRYPHVGYEVVDVKTEAGNREIPMTADVEDAFKRIIANRRKVSVEPSIDGYTDFIFLDKDGSVEVALHWENYFRHAVEKYNKIYRHQLPNVTPHVARHTFCSRMAAKRMNPKTLQYIMGHSDISVTMNTYTHFGFDEIKDEVNRMQAG